MARIPTKEALGPRPIPTGRTQFVPVSPDRSGRGLQQLAKAGQDLAASLQQQEDEATFYANRRELNDFGRQTQEMLLERQGENARGVTTEVLQQFDRKAQEIQSRLSPRQQRAFQELAAARRQHLGNLANRHEITARHDVLDQQFEATVEDSVDRLGMVARDPVQRELERKLLRDRITSHHRFRGTPQETIDNVVQDTFARAHQSAIDGFLADESLADAEDYFNEFRNEIPNDTAKTIRSQLDTFAGRAQRRARSTLNRQIEDAQVAASFGREIEVDESLIGQLPEDEQKDIRFEIETLSSVSDTVKSFPSTPLEERVEQLEAADPRKQPNLPSDRLSEQQRRFEALTAASTELAKRENEDFAGVSVENDPDIKRLYERSVEPLLAPGAVPPQDLDAAREDFAEYVEQVTARADKIGYETKYLPKQLRDQIVAAFQSKGASGEAAAEYITQLRSVTGDYWRAVYADILPDIPPAAIVLGDGLARGTAERVINIANVDTKDLKEPLESTDVTDVDRTVKDLASEYLALMPNNQTAIPYRNALVTETQRLAYSMLSEDTSITATEAARRAHQQIFGRYETGNTFYAPKDRDIAAIEDGASAFVQNLTVEDVGALIDDTGLPTDAIARRESLDAIVDNAEFTNDLTNSGLVLTSVDRQSGIRAPINGPDGYPIRLTFDELEQIGTIADTGFTGFTREAQQAIERNRGSQFRPFEASPGSPEAQQAIEEIKRRRRAEQGRPQVDRDQPTTVEPPEGTAPKAPPSLSSTARGLRNNNFGNIVRTNIRWQGEVESSDPRFEAFATPRDGIRALGRNLKTYQSKHGLRTIEDIIARWAPPEDGNDTEAYIRNVEDLTGLPRDRPLDLTKKPVLAKLTKAIILQENGEQPFDDDTINDALTRIRS